MTFRTLFTEDYNLLGTHPVGVVSAALPAAGSSVTLPGVAWWYADAAGWLVAVLAAGLIGLLSLAAWGMEKKGWIWSV